MFRVFWFAAPIFLAGCGNSPKDAGQTAAHPEPQAAVKEISQSKADAQVAQLWDKIASLEADLASERASGEVLYPGQELKGIPSVCVSVFLDDKFKDIISENELQTKVELKLRSLGITIESSSHQNKHLVQADSFEVTVSGLWEPFGNDKESSLVYHAMGGLYAVVRRETYRNPHWIEEKGEPISLRFTQLASIWQSHWTGYAGKQKQREALANAVGEVAESFANAYLAANPKK